MRKNINILKFKYKILIKLSIIISNIDILRFLITLISNINISMFNQKS